MTLPRITALNTILLLTAPSLTLQPRPLPLVPTALPVAHVTSLLGGLNIPSCSAFRSGTRSRPSPPVYSSPALSLEETGHLVLQFAWLKPAVILLFLRPYTNHQQVLTLPPVCSEFTVLSPPPCSYPHPSCVFPGSCNSLPAGLWLLIFARCGLVSEQPVSLLRTHLILSLLCSKSFWLFHHSPDKSTSPRGGVILTPGSLPVRPPPLQALALLYLQQRVRSALAPALSFLHLECCSPSSAELTVHFLSIFAHVSFVRASLALSLVYFFPLLLSLCVISRLLFILADWLSLLDRKFQESLLLCTMHCCTPSSWKSAGHSVVAQ